MSVPLQVANSNSLKMDAKLRANDAVYYNKISFPAFLLAIYAVIVPFDNLTYTLSMSGTITKYLLIIVTCVVLTNLIVMDNKQITKQPFSNLMWILFMCLMLISAIWSVSPVLTLQGSITVAGLIITTVVITSYPWSISDLGVIEKGIVLGGFVAALLSIYLSSQGYYYLSTTRASIVFKERVADPNHFASGLILPFCISFYKILNSKTRGQKFILNIIISTILATAVILTGSRGAALGLVVAILFLFFMSKKSGTYLILTLLIIFLVYLFCLNMMPYSLLQRFTLNSILSSGGAGRVPLWHVGLLAFLEKPLTGWGFNTFMIITAGAFPESAYLGVKYQQVAHNIFIQILSEMGIFGLIILVLALAGIFRSSFVSSRKIPNFRPITSAFVGIIVTSLTLGTLNYKYFWLIITLGTLRIVKSSRCLT